MKIISVYNQKGGVGKTTLVYLLGIYARYLNKKVLLLDLDSQESLSQAFLKDDYSGSTSFDFLSESKELKDCIYKIDEKLHILVGDLKILKLKNNVSLSFLKRNLAKLNYDYVIIDNSPSHDNLIVSSLIASNVVIIPTLLSKFDTKSLRFTLNEIKEHREDVKKVVVFNRTGKITNEINGIVKENSDLLKSCKVSNFINYSVIRKFIEKSKPIDSNPKLFHETENLYGYINE